MFLMKLFAIGLLMLWGGIVVLGLLGKRRGAAVLAGLAAVTVCVPFLPRLVHYLLDQDGFVARYGAAAINEVVVSGICVALGFLALITVPLAAKYAWGWILPAISTLPPLALFVWLAFWFRIFF
jgi:hypothetical protein